MKEKVQKENQWLRWSSLAPLVVVAALSSEARAQEHAQEQIRQQTVYYACYVPEVGAMYLIKMGGLPTDCLSTNHQLITWSEDGAAGTQGPQGEQGEQGIQGAEGPAGVSCWDLNGDGVQDPEEDTNEDLAWDAQDCRGEQGEQGPPGEGGGIPDGSVTTVKLADSAITDLKLAPAAVTNTHLADNAVTAVKVGFRTLVDDNLTDDAVTARVIAAGAVGSSEIATGAVSSSEIANNAVGSSEIAAGAVGSSEVANNSLTANDLATDAVTFEVAFANSNYTIAANRSISATVYCSSSFVSTAGGWHISSATIDAMDQVVVTKNRPWNNNGWTFYIRNAGNTEMIIVLFVRCVRLVM